MKLNIKNEFGRLKSAVVCWGTNVPVRDTYKNSDPEYVKYHNKSWDKKLLIKQQETFFKKLQKYKVNLIFPEAKKELQHQMFTRDTAFIIGDKLSYSKLRKFKDRNGEIESLLLALGLNSNQYVEIDKEIEGGDVLVRDSKSIYMGCGSRTNSGALELLEQAGIDTKIFKFGDRIMHLDTRLALLPKNYALINTSSFLKEDYEFLKKEHHLIEVADNEAWELGTNVFVVDTETIFVAKQHKRIAGILRDLGFNIEIIDYSEPINLRGSFRCTTLPLCRDD